MGKLYKLLTIIVVIIVLQCNGGGEDEEGPLTRFPKIDTIRFGAGWFAPDSTIDWPDSVFSNIKTVYYEVRFDSALGNWFRVKKEWERSDTLLFTSVVLLPQGTKRLCGEIRRFDNQNLERGWYRIRLLYFRPDSARYFPVEHPIGAGSPYFIIR